jgi:hypothetical protein
MGFDPVGTRWGIDAQMGQLAWHHRGAQEQTGAMLTHIPELAGVAQIDSAKVNPDRQIAGRHRKTMAATLHFGFGFASIRENILGDWVEKLKHVRGCKDYRIWAMLCRR